MKKVIFLIVIIITMFLFSLFSCGCSYRESEFDEEKVIDNNSEYLAYLLNTGMSINDALFQIEKTLKSTMGVETVERAENSVMVTFDNGHVHLIFVVLSAINAELLSQNEEIEEYGTLTSRIIPQAVDNRKAIILCPFAFMDPNDFGLLEQLFDDAGYITDVKLDDWVSVEFIEDYITDYSVVIWESHGSSTNIVTGEVAPREEKDKKKLQMKDSGEIIKG